MNVGLFMDARTIGGIEKHVLSLVSYLQKFSGHKITLLLWQNYGDEHLIAAIESLPTEVKIEFLDSRYSRLVAAVHTNALHVIHTHGYKAGLLGRLVAKQFGIGCVSTHHNGDPGAGVVRLYTLADSLTSFLATNISVSKRIQRRLFWPSHYINNFVNDIRYVDSDTQNCIAFVGRLSNEKRVDRFIELARQLPKGEFEIYGDGSEKGSMLKQIQSEKIGNCVYKGFCPDVSGIWNRAQAIVICSDFEGLPLVALEAMAHGVPVFSLALGELPNVIDHGIEGFIAEDMSGLRSNLETWLAMDETKKECIKRAAFNKIRNNYSADASVKKVIGLYRKEIDKSRVKADRKITIV